MTTISSNTNVYQEIVDFFAKVQLQKWLLIFKFQMKQKKKLQT